jgi:hypothetical protein
MLISVFGLYAEEQDSLTLKAYFSLNSGCFVTSDNYISKTHGDYFFINGLTIGLSFSQLPYYLRFKIMKFGKAGESELDYFQNYIGGQYIINDHKKIRFPIQFGIIYQNMKSITHDYPATSERSLRGIAGWYYGIGVEKEFKKIPLSLCLEIEDGFFLFWLPGYSLVIERKNKYLGTNINFGLKYRIKIL